MAASTIKMNPVTDRRFPDLPLAVSEALEAVGSTKTYSSGAFLFTEDECARGIFIVRLGQVKLSVGGSDGKIIVLRKAGPGDALGLSASLCCSRYETTAETQGRCEITFIGLSDFQRLAHVHGELPLWAAQHLSREYDAMCYEIRYVASPGSATRRLSRLLVDWLSRVGEPGSAGRMKFGKGHCSMILAPQHNEACWAAL